MRRFVLTVVALAVMVGSVAAQETPRAQSTIQEVEPATSDPSILDGQALALAAGSAAGEATQEVEPATTFVNERGYAALSNAIKLIVGTSPPAQRQEILRTLDYWASPGASEHSRTTAEAIRAMLNEALVRP